MNTRLLIAALLGATLVMTCSKKDTAKPAENPITQYVDSEPNLLIYESNGSGEVGLVFASSVNGTITQLGCKRPQASAYSVTLWDFDNKTVLRRALVTQTMPGKLTLTDVDELKITANKRYVISTNMESKYEGYKPPYFAYKGGSAFMPVTKGNITIYNACSIASVTAFPGANATTTSMLGFADFTFIPD